MTPLEHFVNSGFSHEILMAEVRLLCFCLFFSHDFYCGSKVADLRWQSDFVFSDKRKINLHLAAIFK